jgi:uncharacterized membrane protein
VSFARPFSRISMGLWFVPLVCVLAGVGLSFGTIAIDKAYEYKLVPQSITGGPDAALEILGTVAASMVSLAALVLTITMVVVQLAMGQFSPRMSSAFCRTSLASSQLAFLSRPLRTPYWRSGRCKPRAGASCRGSLSSSHLCS